jgi:hypothetical protein
VKPKEQVAGNVFIQRFSRVVADSAATGGGWSYPLGHAPWGAGSAVAVRIPTVRTEYVGHTRVPTPSPAQLGALNATVHSLQERVRALEQQLTPSVFVVRDLSPEQAKKELLDYFQRNPGTYPSDAALALKLDSAVVRDLCLELVEEGLLAG